MTDGTWDEQMQMQRGIDRTIERDLKEVQKQNPGVVPVRNAPKAKVMFRLPQEVKLREVQETEESNDPEGLPGIVTEK